MIPNLAVSDDTMKRARSFTDTRGISRLRREESAMDEILASAQLGNGRSVHIATLARQTIIDSGAEHLGFSGYFLFESNDLPGEKGISVLGKISSLEAALRLIDIWGLGHQVA
jgi:hypothetical protein